MSYYKYCSIQVVMRTICIRRNLVSTYTSVEYTLVFISGEYILFQVRLLLLVQYKIHYKDCLMSLCPVQSMDD